MKLSLVLMVILFASRSLLQQGRPRQITPEQVRPYLLGQRLIRIALAEAASEVALEGERGIEVRDSSGRLVFSMPPGQELRISGKSALRCRTPDNELSTNAQKLVISGNGPVAVSFGNGKRPMRCPGSIEVS